MKTKATYLMLCFALAIVFSAYTDPYSKKNVSDKNYRYEFYVTDKIINPQPHKVYYWFKGGAVHSAQGGATGTLLNKKFIKSYHSNQIAELGNFRKGLKEGVWKTWYEDGTMATVENWSKGLRTGKYVKFDKAGAIAEKGSYRKDMKHGIWYDYVKKDTTDYSRGTVVERKLVLPRSQQIANRRKEMKKNAKENIALQEEKVKLLLDKKSQKESIISQKVAFEKEKASIKDDVKQAYEKAAAVKDSLNDVEKKERETLKAQKATQKTQKNTADTSWTTSKKDNAITRFFGKLFSKKTTE